MVLTLLLLQLTVCAAAIGGAGFALTRSADAIADAYGWGRGWVGLALLATVTSLPELVSGVSSVLVVDAPNLAVGNALGACVFNLAFLIVVDALHRGESMYRRASPTHLLSAAFGVVMLGFTAMSLLFGTHAPRLFHVGLYSPALLGLYLLMLRSMHGHERAAQQAAEPAARPHTVDKRREWQRFALAALVVVGAGAWLPQVADSLAGALGLSRSFVGTVMMAVVTTLPEIAVSLGALRLGALDMALGNLLGSNLFNVAILAVDDAVYLRGPLLADAAPVHAGTAIIGVVMSGLMIIGLLVRPRGRLLRIVSWISVALAGAYALNAAVIYLLGD